MKTIKAFIGVGAFALIIVLAFMLTSNKQKETTLPFKELDFVIEKGSNAKTVSMNLKEEGLRQSANQFKAFMAKEGYAEKIQAGTFRLNSEMSDEEICKIITTPVKKKSKKITIKEGWANQDIIDYLSKEMNFSKEKLSTIFAHPQKLDKDRFTFLKKLAEDDTLEGYLFPETYEVYLDATEEAVTEKLLSQFEKVYQNTIQGQMGEKPLREIITMASLIEGEAKLDEERSLIASVFYNRLKKNMKLESCATVQYALGEHKERLLFKDLEIESPYNTYKYEGLPKGPIGNPGLKSIEAALNPQESPYLFFTYNFDGTGTHTFTKTLAEHNKATQKAQKNRGN